MSKLLRLSFLSLFILVLISGLALAQTRVTGVIEGRVSDEERAPLAGVNITITSPSLMGIRTTVTDREGRYRFVALPAGSYSIEIFLQGFTAAKRTEVIVHGGMTATIDIVMTLAKINEEVTVLGEAPLIDVTSSSLGNTYLAKDFLENIPTSQDVTLIYNLAPGVQKGSAYGSGNYTGNVFQLDGVELTDSWFGGGLYTAAIDYNIIEEAQFIALGAPAEFGNFTGDSINIITKSGGNFLSGDAQLLGKGKKWHSENIDKSDPKYSILRESALTDLFDVSFHLGGPILKDKLWFFGGYRYWKSTMEMVSANKTSQTTYPKAFLKFTFQPNENNRFQVSVENHSHTQENVSLSPLVPDVANYANNYPIWVGSLSFLHTFSPQTLLEVKITGYSMKQHYIPSQGRDVSGHIDLVTGEASINSTFWAEWESARYSLHSALSHHADNFIKGSHDLKLGLEVEYSSGGGTEDPNGGIYFMDYDHQPYLAQAYHFKSWGVNRRYTGFAQDDWKVSDSLVINPGLRFSLIYGSIPDLNRTVFKPKNLEPRIGLVWDIAKDHKTIIKAHYGKYFEGTKTYYFARMQPSGDTITYSVGPNWSTLTELYRIPGESLVSIDPDSKHPSMDQVVAGIEQVLGKDLSLNVSLIYRSWHNFLEPVNLTGIFEKVPFTDPETGQVFTIYNQLNPGADKYYITNPTVGKDYGQAYPDLVRVNPWRKYRGIQFEIKKRLSNNWQFSASYVYSKEQGTYSNAHTTTSSYNMGWSSNYIDPNYQTNLEGRSLFSPPHVLKIYATYFFPLDISLSAFYNYSSGQTWTRLDLVSGLNQGAVRIMTEPMGSRRYPATSNLDLRVEKSFRYRTYRLSAMLDVFNLFNRAIPGFEEVRSGRAIYDTAGARFGKVLSVIPGRTFRASLMLSF